MADPSNAPVAGQIAWRYSPSEIWADGVIHVLGVVLALAGACVFVIAFANSPAVELAAIAIYLATLVLSVAASAAYNLWPVSRAKWLLRRLDHSAIYLLIAGTYTPFMVKLGTWWLLVAMWAVALTGVALKLLWPGRFDRFSIGLYLALGWSGVVVFDELRASLPSATLWLIGTGGLVYSAGVIFHLWDRLRFQNVIWHGFVLTASAVHFAAVWSAM